MHAAAGVLVPAGVHVQHPRLRLALALKPTRRLIHFGINNKGAIAPGMHTQRDPLCTGSSSRCSPAVMMCLSSRVCGVGFSSSAPEYGRRSEASAAASSPALATYLIEDILQDQQQGCT